LTLACAQPAERARAPAGSGEDRLRTEAQECLDSLHRLAAAADAPAYFALFAPEATYLGTDATERWSVAEFRGWAEPYFATGRGWDYRVTERHLSLSADEATAWFDERLQNDSYGECRGSGVLVRRDGRWLIAQYVLSLPVPNELARDLVGRIRALQGAAPAPPTPVGGGL
jgi:hypothetical protein